jgi:hypothetical protein
MKIDINLGMNPMQTKIKIDGVEAERVKSLKINASVDEIPSIILELCPDEINITGDVLALKNVGLEDYSNQELLDIVARRCITKVI